MRSEVVANEECYVWAIKVLEGGVTKVIIRHSRLLTSDDPMFDPVRAALDEQCACKEVERSEEDPDMWFGEAVVLEYRLLEVCPGAEAPHRCVEDRRDVAA